MLLLLLPLLLGLFAVVLVALLALRRPPSRLWAGVSGRARSLAESWVTRLTPLGAAAALGLVGTTLVAIVFVPLGKLAGSLGAGDLDVFRWTATREHQLASSHTLRKWLHWMDIATQMGNKHQIWAVTGVSALVLVLVFRRRRWVPPLVLAGAVGAEHFLQIWLARVVDRGHPPTTLGTWPSGGVARVICVYGLVVFLALLVYQPNRPTVVVSWAGLACLAVVEGYTRWVLQKHWLTDVLGGFLFGTALLAAFALATLALQPAEGARTPRRARAGVRGRAAGRHPAASGPRFGARVSGT